MARRFRAVLDEKLERATRTSDLDTARTCTSRCLRGARPAKADCLRLAQLGKLTTSISTHAPAAADMWHIFDVIVVNSSIVLLAIERSNLPIHNSSWASNTWVKQVRSQSRERTSREEERERQRERQEGVKEIYWW